MNILTTKKQVLYNNKHTIDRNNPKPVYTKSYSPLIHKEEVHIQVSKMLKQDIVCLSNSPWCFPVWIILKKLDASVTIRTNVSYLSIQFISPTWQVSMFTSLGLNSGFHQMEPKYIQKTVFILQTHHFQFCKSIELPQKTSSKGSTFCHRLRICKVVRRTQTSSHFNRYYNSAQFT